MKVAFPGVCHSVPFRQLNAPGGFALSRFFDPGVQRMCHKSRMTSGGRF
jgi:hypothetical protein